MSKPRPSIAALLICPLPYRTLFFFVLFCLFLILILPSSTHISYSFLTPSNPTPIPTMFWTQSITASSKKTKKKNTNKTHRNALLPCNRILDIKELRDLICSFLPHRHDNGKLIYLSPVLVCRHWHRYFTRLLRMSAFCPSGAPPPPSLFFSHAHVSFFLPSSSRP